MTSDDLNIVASNLTIAYFSRYEREKKPERKETDSFDATETLEAAGRDTVITVYEHFRKELEKSHSNNESGT